MNVHEALQAVFVFFGYPAMAYFLFVNGSYLFFVVAAALDVREYQRRKEYAGLDEIASSSLTQPISVIMPAFNEEAGVVSAVMAMLALRYPAHEVIVVDDGSTDDMFARLRESFDLVEIPRHIPELISMREHPTSVHVPADGYTPLVVVRKKNSGAGDSTNVGVNAARYPLVAFIDSDSILDPDALLVVAAPFTDDPERVIASGGAIRAVNGCRVVSGRVVDVRIAKPWLVRIQVVEYLRAFMLGRAGWSRLNAMMIISGAFGLFRRDMVIEIGGLDPDNIGQDMELVLRLHRVMREKRRDYRVVYMAAPTLWTEVPSTTAVLGRQRRRWHRGLWEVLWKHRRMVGNPRYGRIGVLALPYFWLVELLAPVLELAGLVIVPLALILGITDWRFALAIMLATYGFAAVVTLAALCVEEFTFHRYERWRDLATSIAASAVENIGYRQLNCWWRVRGLIQGIRRAQREWGVMTRTGFADSATTSASPGSPPVTARPAGQSATPTHPSSSGTDE
ncbi:MAG: glycosyltransferase family 2 protein [Actinomycetales bacterium]